MIFFALLFAHLLADYPLQGEFLATMKGKNVLILFSHAGIWTGCIAITGLLCGLQVSALQVLLLFSVHALADAAKAKRWSVYADLDPLGWGLMLDQLIHMVQILVFMVGA